MGEAGGARVVDGLSMLIAQGVAALELWLGRSVDPRIAAGAHGVAAQELGRRMAG
jgi:shikimate 5-dehydrogenase